MIAGDREGDTPKLSCFSLLPTVFRSVAGVWETGKAYAYLSSLQVSFFLVIEKMGSQ